MHWTDEFFDGPYGIELKEMSAAEIERAEREAEFICAQLELKDTDRVLDLACGYGRHTFPVALNVGRIVGFDRTESFIEAARTRAENDNRTNIEFIEGDMRDLKFDSEFDAVFNYFTAWGYWDDGANQDVLEGVFRSLKPGGRFLLEYLHRDWLVRNFEPRGWLDIGGGKIMLAERRFDCATGRQFEKRIYMAGDGDMMKKVYEIEIELRMPTGSEFTHMFHKAGFEDVRVMEAPSGDQLEIESKRVAVAGRKPG